MPVDEHLSMAECPSCRTPVHRWKAAGIEYTADLPVVDAQTATAAVLAGRRLYRVTWAGGQANIRLAYHTELAALSSAEPPHIVASHPCKAVTRSLTAVPPSGGAGAPGKAPSPSAGRTAASSGVSRWLSAQRAAQRRSDGPRCDSCGQPCADGTYASIELGTLTLWAQHVQEGGCTPA